MTAEHPALPRRDDILVNKSAKAPKSHLPPVEVRMLPSTTGGLLLAGTASRAMKTIFPRPVFSCSLGGLGEDTKKSNSRTNNQLAPPCWRKFIQTKLRQTLEFDPGSSTGRLPACPFLGGWRVLLLGEVVVWAPDGTRG